MNRYALATVLAAVCLAPATAISQDASTIQHEAVGCLVAGQYPVLSACFPQPPARARVYFRGARTPHWYYVDMQPEGNCSSGTLPRPKESLGSVSYYIDAVGSSFAQSRTEEYAPRVVKSEAQCGSLGKAAKWVSRASIVLGLVPGAPAIPAGFAAGGIAGVGGGSTLTVIGVVAGGAAAAAGAVALSKGDESSGAAPMVIPQASNPPPVPMPSPSPTPVTTPNQPPQLVVAVSPQPARGESPLVVNFNLCRSSDPDEDPLTYSFDFGDGIRDSGVCRSEHTYSAGGAAEFGARLCVADASQEVCETVTVVLLAPEPEPDSHPF